MQHEKTKMNETKDTGGNAFPRGTYKYDGHNNILTYQEEGMSLRDYFATAALPVAFQLFDKEYTATNLSDAGIAKCAYKLADEMLKERLNVR
jgi:hypothetical protein